MNKYNLKVPETIGMKQSKVLTKYEKHLLNTVISHPKQKLQIKNEPISKVRGVFD